MSRYASNTASGIVNSGFINSLTVNSVIFDNGVPAEVAFGQVRLPVVGIVDAWREWYDVLGGEPERDVWILETERGICEIHGLRAVPGKDTQGSDQTREGNKTQKGNETREDGERPCDQWVLCRWED